MEVCLGSCEPDITVSPSSPALIAALVTLETRESEGHLLDHHHSFPWAGGIFVRIRLVVAPWLCDLELMSRLSLFLIYKAGGKSELILLVE